MCKILIDGDGCPVVSQTIAIAQAYAIAVIIVCDTAHYFNDDYAEVIMGDTGKDQSDFLLLKHTVPHDIVITQDYGLATLVLAKGAYALSQNAFSYNDDNIAELLNSRHQHAKMRKHKHYGHILKRCQEDDDNYCKVLENKLIEMGKHRNQSQ